MNLICFSCVLLTYILIITLKWFTLKLYEHLSAAVTLWLWRILHVLLYTRIVGVCLSVYACFGGKAKQVCVWVAIVWGQMAIGPKRNNKNKTKPLYCFCFNLLRNFARTYRVWENRSKKKTSTTAPVYVFHVWFRQKKNSTV